MAELTPNRLTHLKQLEAESIHIIREVAAEFEKPVMLYSIGKDSSVLVRLARQGVPSGAAAVPAPAHRHHLEVPRDDRVPRSLLPRAAGSSSSSTPTPTALREGINPFDHGSEKYTSVMKTQALVQALTRHGFDAAFGGARRDEEKSRAKERIYCFRDRYQQWDPKNQRPGTVEPVQRQGDEGREHPRLSRCRTGPSSTSGSTSTWRTSPSCPCTSPSPRPRGRARRRAHHGRRRAHAPASGRGAGGADHPLPHARLLSAVGRDREQRHHAARDHPRDAADAAVGAAGAAHRPRPGRVDGDARSAKGTSSCPR